jgi:hypothetical protein
MGITPHQIAKLNLDCFGTRMGGFNQAKGPESAELNGKQVNLAYGFCAGACHHWIHRAIRAGHLGFLSTDKDSKKIEKQKLRTEMAVTHASFFQRGGAPAYPNVGNSIGTRGSDGVPSFRGLQLIDWQPSTRVSRGLKQLPDETIKDIVLHVTNKLKEEQFARGAVIGISYHPKGGHAVSVVKTGISYGLGFTQMKYYFFDPNLGIWDLNEDGLIKVLQYLFGSLPRDSLTSFAVRVPSTQIQAAKLGRKLQALQLPGDQLWTSRDWIHFAAPTAKYKDVVALSLPYERDQGKAEQRLADMAETDAEEFISVFANNIYPYYSEDAVFDGSWDCAILGP